jgi:peroxiredoxin
MWRVLLLVVLMFCPSTFAQDLQENPAAAKAFAEFLTAFRSHEAVAIKSVVRITTKRGDVEKKGPEVSATFRYGMGKDAPRRAVIELRGFTCWSADGKLWAVHESNPHDYFVMDDDESPYYALLGVFVDLPFPDLALALGNEAPEDVIMQLHPRAPMVVPSAVADVTKDRKALRKITFQGAHERVELTIDPDVNLPRALEAEISGGDFAEEGSAVRYTHTFDATIPEKPFGEDTFRFDRGDRQRVDMVVSLQKAAPAPDAEAAAPEGGLVGQPAPRFTLETMDGKAIDLNDLQGRVVVIDFWATWCKPCVLALPKLHEVAAWAKDNQLPVTVLTINLEGGNNPGQVLETVRQFWTTNKFTLPVAMDHSGETAGAYGVRGIPATYVIRSDGAVHAAHTGAGADYVATLQRDITAAIAALEGKPAEAPGR